MRQLVAFTGPAGSGKTTSAAWLVERHAFLRTSFAEPIRGMLDAFLAYCSVPVPERARMLRGDLKEAPTPLLGGGSPRHAMQTLGTEWGRELIGPDLWVDAWRRSAAPRLAADGRLVLDDLRFENEAAAVRALGGIVIGVRGRGGIPGGHASEAGVIPDLWVANTGTVADLHATLRRALGA